MDATHHTRSKSVWVVAFTLEMSSWGTQLRDQYTALGPNVNFAQRIEARAGIGEILISAPTRARLGDQFELQDAGIVNDIKNIPGEFKLFSVIRAKK